MDIIEQTIDQALAHHKSGEFDRASHLYNAVLNLKPFDEGVLYLLSDLYLRMEYSGLAVNLLTNLLDRYPKNGSAWCNLGIAFRKEDRYEQAIQAWNRALKLQGDTAEVCCNMATLYSDRAQPDKAIHWLDRSLKCDPDSVGARWSKSLALLTKKDWAQGWPLYEFRQQLEGWHSRTSVDVPMWDFKPTEHLYIHGEQGVGDEIMFLSCLDDVLPLAKRVTLELNERVAGIAKQTWPSVSIVTTETPGDYTAKIAIGSLAARLRRDEAAFPGVAYLKPCPTLVGLYRARLEALGPRPWVGVAWHGGTKLTRVQDRSATLHDFKPILDRFTCVSAQYEHTNPMLTAAREEAKLPMLDSLCVGADLAHQAALFAALDFVVTVQQTAVHVAGAVGAKTYALIGPYPHWRYGIEGDMPWYQSVKLCRAKNGWAEQVTKVEKAIADQFGLSGAERAVSRAAA